MLLFLTFLTLLATTPAMGSGHPGAELCTGQTSARVGGLQNYRYGLCLHSPSDHTHTLKWDIALCSDVIILSWFYTKGSSCCLKIFLVTFNFLNLLQFTPPHVFCLKYFILLSLFFYFLHLNIASSEDMRAECLTNINIATWINNSCCDDVTT